MRKKLRGIDLAWCDTAFGTQKSGVQIAHTPLIKQINLFFTSLPNDSFKFFLMDRYSYWFCYYSLVFKKTPLLKIKIPSSSLWKNLKSKIRLIHSFKKNTRLSIRYKFHKKFDFGLKRYVLIFQI